MAFVHHGPAAALALASFPALQSVIFTEDVLEAINTLLVRLAQSTVQKLVDGVDGKEQQPPQHRHVKCPITTDTLKSAFLATCGRSNALAREAVLEAQLILREWIATKRLESDAAIPRSAGLGEDIEKAGQTSSNDNLDVPTPRSSKRLSGTSISPLEIIMDEMEAEEEAEEALQTQQGTSKPLPPPPPSSIPAVPLVVYERELLAALEHLSPLGLRSIFPRTFKARSTGAIALIHKHSLLKHTTPLLVLYAFTLFDCIARATVLALTSAAVEARDDPARSMPRRESDEGRLEIGREALEEVIQMESSPLGMLWNNVMKLNDVSHSRSSSWSAVPRTQDAKARRSRSLSSKTPGARISPCITYSSSTSSSPTAHTNAIAGQDFKRGRSVSASSAHLSHSDSERRALRKHQHRKATLRLSIDTSLASASASYSRTPTIVAFSASSPDLASPRSFLSAPVDLSPCAGLGINNTSHTERSYAMPLLSPVASLLGRKASKRRAALDQSSSPTPTLPPYPSAYSPSMRSGTPASFTSAQSSPAFSPAMSEEQQADSSFLLVSPNVLATIPSSDLEADYEQKPQENVDEQEAEDCVSATLSMRSAPPREHTTAWTSSPVLEAASPRARLRLKRSHGRPPSRTQSLRESKRPLGLGLSSTNASGSSPPRSPSRNGITTIDISRRRHTHSVSLSLAPAQGISSSSSSSASALSSTGLNSSNSNSSPTSSSHTARKRSSESAQRRISEDAEFEDLIRRGDTLHMTLTPSRFRPESGSRKSQNGKKASSGIAKLSGRSRGNSTSSSTSANGSQSDSGLSASHRNGSSNGLSNFGLSNTSMSGANSHGSIPGVQKMRARSAVAPRRRLGEDEDSSSAADGAAQQDEEAEELDSEDEALLGITAHVKRKRAAAATTAADSKNGKKESLFDILNSEPPWERDSGSSTSAQPSRQTELFVLASPTSMAAKKTNSTIGLSRTEKLLGLSATGPNAGSRTTPLQVSRLQSHSAMSAPPTQRFAPIANLDLIGKLDLSERQDETATLRGAPSIADSNSRSLNSAIAPSFDQGANASTDFFLPSGKADPIASTQGTTNTQRQTIGSASTKPQLASYKSSPNLSSPSSGSDSAVSLSHWTSSAPSSASPAVPAFLAPKYSSASLGAAAAGVPAGGRNRRLQAKDERSVGKDNNNDDLIAFLRDATPPPPSAASAGLETSLPVKGSSSSTTGKSRLGSSKFRSFLSGGSSSKNRPSTASSVDNLARGSSTLPLRSNILGGNGLPAVDELGRNVGSSSSLTASLTPLNRKLSKSRSREGLRAGSMPAYLPEGAGSSLHASSLLPASTVGGDFASGVGGGNLGWTSVVSSNGNAASPAAKQAHREWESANAAVDVQQQAAMDKYGYLPRIASASSPPVQDTRYKPYGFDGSYQAALQQPLQREVVSHPGPGDVYDTISEPRQQPSETPLLTPETSRDSLHRLSSTAKAISGFETPPDSPEQGTHSTTASHSPVQTTAQYRALHSLPEEDAERPRTSTSTVSGSPSAVMPGMAHKHQRRLSAVRRKPSPRVDGEIVQQPQQSQQETITSARASPELKGLAITSTAPVVVSVSAQTTPLGGRSREPSISSSHVSASSAVRLTDAYHDGSSSTTVPAQAIDAQSVASSKYTSNILETVPRAPSLTSVASRPVSSMALIVPLSPRRGNAQNASADIHDVLLSLRNNMISAASVVECLEMIDAALFEVAYDTNKLGYSPASTITIEEETDFEPDKAHGQESDLKQSLLVEDVNEHGYSGRRTPRYISRAFGAIIDYYLSSLSSSIDVLGYDASLTDQSTDVEDLDVNDEAAAAISPLATAMTERTPSLGYSAGDSTSVESDDGSVPVLAVSAVDEDKNSYTLPPLPSGKVASLSSEELSFIDSEEEQEILQKAVEAISAA